MDESQTVYQFVVYYRDVIPAAIAHLNGLQHVSPTITKLGVKDRNGVKSPRLLINLWLPNAKKVNYSSDIGYIENMLARLLRQGEIITYLGRSVTAGQVGKI